MTDNAVTVAFPFFVPITGIAFGLASVARHAGIINAWGQFVATCSTDAAHRQQERFRVGQCAWHPCTGEMK